MGDIAQLPVNAELTDKQTNSGVSMGDIAQLPVNVDKNA